CSAAAGGPLLAGLRRFAPSWLCLLPGILDADEARAMQQRLRGTTPDRLALEMTTFVAAVTEPPVLVLEDLHWSDSATPEVRNAVAQRRDPARLLVLGTYRAADAAVHEHPMKLMHHSLRTRGQCHDLWLRAFDEDAVRAYLDRRCQGLPPVDAHALTRLILDRT